MHNLLNVVVTVYEPAFALELVLVPIEDLRLERRQLLQYQAVNMVRFDKIVRNWALGV
jgi:hypothetical protein